MLTSVPTVRATLWLAALLTATVLGEAAQACQICIPKPTQTLADRLLSSDAVVLAREDPERPFHFATVEVLHGDPNQIPIDAFLNSQARRRLAMDPDAAMLIGRDGKTGKWQTLGIAGGEFEQVTRQVLSFSGDWQPGETNNAARLREFAQWLGHEDQRLHELAYLEVGRAPYATIRSISADIPLEQVRGMLDDPQYLEWRSLAILLLGQSTIDADQARVQRTMLNKQRLSGTLNLDAWATAYVAITGREGVEQLSDWYLNDKRRSRGELKAILRALSVLGAGDPDLREPITTAYRVLLAVHPRLAPEVARDLISWAQWDLATPMRAIRPQIAEADPLGAYAIDQYLLRADVYRETTGD